MITVNAMGDACPIPVIKTKKALDELNGTGMAEVLVDNETAVKNVTKMAESSGAKVTQEKVAEGQYRILITLSESAQTEKGKAGAPAAEKQEPEETESGKMNGNMVVVISSDKMGAGDAELGKVLIKGFIFAVSQLERLPDKIVFYNGGAKLTAEGSASLADLKAMEAEGVEIMTCGTCLDFYGLKDKLAVGSVTNMYSIVETMQQAGQILRP